MCRLQALTEAGLVLISSREGLAHRCVEVVYMTTLLRDGYGFPEHSRNVTFALEAAGMEVRIEAGAACARLCQDAGIETECRVRAPYIRPASPCAVAAWYGCSWE